MTDTEIRETPGEPPEPAAEAWLQVSARLGDLTQTMKRERAARVREQPLRAPVYRAGTVAADTALVLDLGAPAMGRRWDVKTLSVTNAADATATVTGTALVYVGQPGAYGAPGVRWNMSTLPDFLRFSSEQLGVTPPDHLLVVVSGGTTNDVLLARADILDYPLTLPSAVLPV